MKVILVGASGNIGRGVGRAVSANHQVVRVGLSDGDVQCDYTDPESVRSMFATVGSYDALVSAVGGDSRFLPFEELSDDDFRYGFERKFLSQIRLMTLGQPTIRDGRLVYVDQRIPEPLLEPERYRHGAVQFGARNLCGAHGPVLASRHSNQRRQSGPRGGAWK